MSARVLTPTLILCLAGAVAGGIALARPATTPAPASTAPTRPAATAGAGAGYGRRTPTAPAAGARTDRAVTMTISSFSFGAPLTVSPGTRVTVRNQDSAPHTVTGDGFDTGTVPAGGTGTFTAPSSPGTYRFSCQIHPSMTGSLTVRS